MTLSIEAANRKDIATGKAGMEHRHFATIAAIFRRIYVDSIIPDPELKTVVEAFADELAATNPRFDRKRFLLACKA